MASLFSSAFSSCSSLCLLSGVAFPGVTFTDKACKTKKSQAPRPSPGLPGSSFFMLCKYNHILPTLRFKYLYWFWLWICITNKEHAVCFHTVKITLRSATSSLLDWFRICVTPKAVWTKTVFGVLMTWPLNRTGSNNQQVFCTCSFTPTLSAAVDVPTWTP